MLYISLLRVSLSRNPPLHAQKPPWASQLPVQLWCPVPIRSQGISNARRSDDTGRDSYGYPSADTDGANTVAVLVAHARSEREDRAARTWWLDRAGG